MLLTHRPSSANTKQNIKMIAWRLSESESDEPFGASSVSSFAAAISATAVYVLININMI